MKNSFLLSVTMLVGSLYAADGQEPEMADKVRVLTLEDRGDDKKKYDYAEDHPDVKKLLEKYRKLGDSFAWAAKYSSTCTTPLASNGVTPLHVLAKYFPYAVLFNLHADAEWKVKTIENETPLLFAVKSNPHLDAIRLIAEYSGAEVDTPDTAGDWPLLVAVRENKLDATAVLLEHGANVNGVNVGGGIVSPFAYSRTLGMVALLIAHSADVDGQDRYGKTLYEKEMEKGEPNRKLIELLEDYHKVSNVDLSLSWAPFD